jgi:type I restriction enzyme S subunit
MRSNYRRIGDFIELVDERNIDLKVDTLLGLSIDKIFIPSVANTVGTNMKRYKIIRKNQFACSVMQVRRDKKMPVALLKEYDEAIISQAYPVFQVKNESELLPDYLMMWMSREEFDRHACFLAVGGVRGSLEWEDFLDIELPVPSIEKQQEIVAEYNTVVNRIKLNEKLNQKLEETVQALFQDMFSISKGNTKLKNFISFNPRESLKKGEERYYVELADIDENYMSIKNKTKRKYKSGTKFRSSDTLLVRITPSFENGKTAFVDNIAKDEIAFGSTEFIVMRAKERISPYWVYCLARDSHFRDYALSSMTGSSGRRRVQHNYLKEYKISDNIKNNMSVFHERCEPFFKVIKENVDMSSSLKELQSLLLSKMTKVDTSAEKEMV